MPNPCSALLVWLQPEHISQENGKKIAKSLAALLFDAILVSPGASASHSSCSSPSAPFPKAGVADNLYQLDPLPEAEDSW